MADDQPDLDATEAAIQRDNAAGEPVAPSDAPVCGEAGCTKPPGFGPFKRYCEEHAPLHKPGRKKGSGGSAPAAPRKSRATGTTARRPASLKAKIKGTVLMTAAVASVSDPRIYVAVEATVDQFAEAWANVADTSPTARRYIEQLLDGSVWVTAIGTSIVMGVTIAACTGRLPQRAGALGVFAIQQAGLEAMFQPAPTNGAQAPTQGAASPPTQGAEAADPWTPPVP